MLWSLLSWRQDAFHHSGFGVQWIRASHLTRSCGGQPDQHRKGGHWRRQHCSPDTERGLGDWALWFRNRECDAKKWLLMAGSWDCDWRCSNCPWVSFYVLIHIPQRNTVARFRIDESVRHNETSSGSSDDGSWHLTSWKHLSRGWYNPARCSIRAAAWTASKFKQLINQLPIASSRVLFSGYWHWPSPFCRLARVRNHPWMCDNDARHPPCSSKLHHSEIYLKHTSSILTMPMCTQLRDWIWDAERGFRLIETG